MRPDKYYRQHQLQGLALVPSPYPPPNDAPLRKFADVRSVQGLFVQSQSTERPEAGAKGIKTLGRFLTGVDESLSSGDVLRDEETGVFVRIVGDPLKPPGRARAQLKTYEAYVSDRESEESAALRGAVESANPSPVTDLGES